MSIVPQIDPATESSRIEKFIQVTLARQGFRNIIIATSGGVDSTTTLFLAVKALGVQNVFALLLPYKNTNPRGSQDTHIAVAKVGLAPSQIETIDIGSMVDMGATLLGLSSKSDSRIHLGNIMARCRMIMLFDRAKKYHCLVLGTENKSEHLLSYFTRFGDEASDIEPIRHLYKTQVYQLAKFLRVPQSIIDKAPTAGLWPGQTDEAEFGFTYETADQILYLLYEKKSPHSQIVKLGIKKAHIKKVSIWVENNRFKHELPIIFTNEK